MSRQPRALPTAREEQRGYSFLEALSFESQDSSVLVLPTVPNSPTYDAPTPRLPLKNAAPTNTNIPTKKPPPVTATPARTTPTPNKSLPAPANKEKTPPVVTVKSLPKTPTKSKSTTNMASAKAQAQCLEMCHKTSQVADRVSVHILDYLTSTKQLPTGFEAMAHDFLDTCQILFAIEAGLAEIIRTSQNFPPEMVKELDSRFRVAQADFRILDQMLSKYLAYETGAMGRMKRGLGKVFGDTDVRKVSQSLAKTRESLRMSSLVFQWGLGSEKVEKEMGIGYTALAAALNRMDQQAGRTPTATVPERSNGTTKAASSPANGATNGAANGHANGHAVKNDVSGFNFGNGDANQRNSPKQSPPFAHADHHRTQSPQQLASPFGIPDSHNGTGNGYSPYNGLDSQGGYPQHSMPSPYGAGDYSNGMNSQLPPLLDTHNSQAGLTALPWSARSSSIQHEQSISRNSGRDARGYASPDLRMFPAPATRSAPSIASADNRHHHDVLDAFDRASTIEEMHSQHGVSEYENLLEEVQKMNLGSAGKGPIRIKAEPGSMPFWTPRASVGTDVDGLKATLFSAVRSKNHRLVEQLLDKGVPANTGAGMHSVREAINGHDAESLRLLLLFGADPNEPDRDGVTPLLASVDRLFFSGAHMLLKYGADPNMAGESHSETPLAAAVIANRVNFVHLMLMYGGNVKHMTTEGHTLMVGGISKRTPRELVDILLEYGSDANAKSKEGQTALFSAIQSNRSDIVSALLDARANPNLPGPKHPLWPSTYHSNCLKVMLAHGADHKKCPGMMELAVSVNNIESVRLLLNAGVNPNLRKDGVYTPLCTAIRDDRSDLLQLLLANGADPNFMASEYPAFKCVTHDRIHFLPPLVDAGADLNAPKGILETAVSFNNMPALKWLLEHGVNPNDKTPKGLTPLTSAIRDNRMEMVDLLLASRADPNVRGQDWPVCMAVRNPPVLKKILAVLSNPQAFKGVMEMAVSADQLESVKLLIGAGVSVEDKNGGVFSPLTTAIREDHKDIVRFLLLEGGADINAPGEHLPIVKALRSIRRHESGHDDTELIELLLSNGADPNKVYRGWNAMMQAVENGDEDILKMICKPYGVDTSARDELGRTVAEIAASRGWTEAADILDEGGRRFQRASMVNARR